MRPGNRRRLRSKTDDWEAELEWADVVVFDDIWVGDDVGTGELARELRERDHAVVGGTPNTYRLEGDRGYAMDWRTSSLLPRRRRP